MIRLVRVELTRLRWRRSVVVLVAAAVLIPLVVLALRAYDTRPVSDGDRLAAEQELAAERELIQEQLAECRADPQKFGAARKNGGNRCEAYLDYQPTIDQYLYREELRIGDERGTSGLGAVAVMAVLVLLVGTTYVGHDWSSGSMSNQLLFEPRRLRVWGAKAIAVALLAAALSVVVLTVFWGGLLLLAQTRDLDPSGQVVTDVVQHAIRGTAMVVAGALAGYALTALTRSTVFTVGTLAVVAVAGGLLFGLLGNDAMRWEPATNAVAAVNGRAEYYVGVPPSCYEGPRYSETGECDPTREITVRQGGLYYGVLLLVLGGASAASYRRRDVP